MPKKFVVLVAEDHPVNQKVMGLLLESLGVQFDYASDGLQAVKAATSLNYGLILMDCMMPHMDGFEASFEIRKFEFHKTRHTPIIACTALDKDRILDQCVRSGINDYIPKPIDRDLLREKIGYWSVIPIAMGPLLPAVAAQIRRLEASDAAEPIDRAHLNVLYGVQQLDDVLELFMEVTEALLAQLESAIQHQDVAIVRRMAHEIKGSSYTVSAREMAQVCRELEAASEEQDWPEVEKLYVSLGQSFARVRECLQHKDNSLKPRKPSTVQRFGLSERRQFEPSIDFYTKCFCLRQKAEQNIRARKQSSGQCFEACIFRIPKRRHNSGFSKSLKNRANPQPAPFPGVKITGVGYSSFNQSEWPQSMEPGFGAGRVQINDRAT